MYFISLLFLVLFSFCSVQAQGIGHYVNNKLKSKLTYQPQTIVEETFFKAYYADGKIKEEGIGKSDQRNGAYKSYYKNGELESEGHYKDNKRKGFWIFYYENGQVKSRENYKYGELRGHFRSYYPNGQLKAKGNFIDIAEPQGIWKFYSPSGELKEEHEYRDKILVSHKSFEEIRSTPTFSQKEVFIYTPLSRIISK